MYQSPFFFSGTVDCSVLWWFLLCLFLDAKSKLETKVTLLAEENVALEVKRWYLICIRGGVCVGGGGVTSFCLGAKISNVLLSMRSVCAVNNWAFVLFVVKTWNVNVTNFVTRWRSCVEWGQQLKSTCHSRTLTRWGFLLFRVILTKKRAGEFTLC